MDVVSVIDAIELHHQTTSVRFALRNSNAHCAYKTCKGFGILANWCKQVPCFCRQQHISVAAKGLQLAPTFDPPSALQATQSDAIGWYISGN
jgi:hypothetical protein